MRFLRMRDLVGKVGLCRQQIWRMEREGKFPKGHFLPAAPSAKVWLESDVDAWMNAQLGATSVETEKAA